MAVWPRRLLNFPIILLAIIQQYIGAFSILVNADAYDATNLQILHHIVPVHVALLLIMVVVPTIAAVGFMAEKKVTTLLCLVPQQLLLYLSAGSGIRAIVLGQYADGTMRSHAFIAADQGLTVFLAVFHTWAMMLILRYGGDAVRGK